MHPTIRILCGKCRHLLGKVRGNGRITHFLHGKAIPPPVVNPHWDELTPPDGTQVSRTFPCKCRARSGNVRQFKVTEAKLMATVDRVRAEHRTELLLGRDL